MPRRRRIGHLGIRADGKEYGDFIPFEGPGRAWEAIKFRILLEGVEQGTRITCRLDDPEGGPGGGFLRFAETEVEAPQEGTAALVWDLPEGLSIMAGRYRLQVVNEDWILSRTVHFGKKPGA